MIDPDPKSNRRLKIEPATRAIAMPADANGNGDTFGRWIMSQMDLAGGSVASLQAPGRVATVGVREIAFHVPVAIGDAVSCYAQFKRRGRASVTTKIEVWVRRRAVDIELKVTEGGFTYVAIEGDGFP
jgi:acyl-CoA thioesterase YciA